MCTEDPEKSTDTRIEALEEDQAEYPIEDLEPVEEVEEVEELTEEAETSALQMADSLVTDILTQSQVACVLDMYDKVPFPVMILTCDLQIVWVNPSFHSIFGSNNDLSGMALFNFFQLPHNRFQAEPIFKSIHSAEYGYSWKGRVQAKDCDSLTFIGNIIIAPIYNHNQEPHTVERRRAEVRDPSAFVAIIDNITEENRAFVKSTFLSLLEASKLKDNDTGQHIQRVNEYSKLLSEYLFEHRIWKNIDRDFIQDISFLAAMHDVGKIGTPDDILNKDGPLSDWEWDVMKEHTINGAYILSTYPAQMAREICLSHHEKWNGSGYPYNFSEGMIPESARIVTLADVYDALRMKRSYKEAFSHEKACDIIREGAGTHFDPELIDIYKRIHRQFRHIYDSLSD